MNCLRCGQHTPRLTLSQRYCPPCEREVARIVEQDEARRNRRVWKPKVLLWN